MKSLRTMLRLGLGLVHWQAADHERAALQQQNHSYASLPGKQLM